MRFTVCASCSGRLAMNSLRNEHFLMSCFVIRVIMKGAT
jgi:hypothetical protein